MMADEELRTEGEIFLAHVNDWRRDHLGESVLIHNQDVLGFFMTLKDAFDKGLELYGLEPFFVREILPPDPVNVSFLGSRIHSD